MEKITILVLGASGLVGNMVFRVLSEDNSYYTYGTIRSDVSKKYFIPLLSKNLITVDNILSPNNILALINKIQPNIIINCISIGRPIPHEFSLLLPSLALFPRRLYYFCELMGIRLINISSDGVFSGKLGNYSETDVPDAQDPYGQSKLLGEVLGNALTFRTSFIGPELFHKMGLLEWVLSNSGTCAGYSSSIFSGVTTLEFSKFLKNVAIPNKKLAGIFHLASTPCSKFDLLNMIKIEYGLDLEIYPEVSLVVDRSLNASLLEFATGYTAPSWGDMLRSLREYSFGLKDGV